MRLSAWVLGIAMIGAALAGCVSDEGKTDDTSGTSATTNSDPCADPTTATHTGTEGPDELDGTDDDDVIFGLGGNDILRGHSGNDIICGGPGDDQIGGGPGDDYIDGGDGEDSCKEGIGTDNSVNCETA